MQGPAWRLFSSWSPCWRRSARATRARRRPSSSAWRRCPRPVAATPSASGAGSCDSCPAPGAPPSTPRASSAPPRSTRRVWCGKVRTKFRASFRAQERQLLLTTPTIRRVVPVLDTSSAETASFHVKPARKGESSTKAPTPVRRHLPSSAELPAPDVQGSHVTQPSTPITRWAVLRWVLRCAWPAGSVLVCPAQRACFITERRKIVIIPITSCVATTFLTSRGSAKNNMCRLQPCIVNKDCL